MGAGRPRIDVECDRAGKSLIVQFADILLQLAPRNDRAGPDVDGNDIQRCIPVDRAATRVERKQRRGVVLVSEPIAASRKIDVP